MKCQLGNITLQLSQDDRITMRRMLCIWSDEIMLDMRIKQSSLIALNGTYSVISGHCDMEKLHRERLNF